MQKLIPLTLDNLQDGGKPSVFDLQGTWNQLKNKEPETTTIRINDTRKIHPVTGEPINPNRDLKTANYNKDVILSTIQAAKKVGVDPYLALAISLQETSLSNDNSEDPYHLQYKPKATWENFTDEVELNAQKNPEDFKHALNFASFLKEKMEYGKKLGYKDLAGQIQAYNGLGVIGENTEKEYHTQTGRNTNYFYGIDVTNGKTIDTRVNPVYGKTVLSFIPFLKENKELQKIIENNENGGLIKLEL